MQNARPRRNTAREESEAGDEIVELGGRHADGDEEDGAIGRNQRLHVTTAGYLDATVFWIGNIVPAPFSATVRRNRFPVVRRQPRKFKLSSAPVATLTRVKFSIRRQSPRFDDDLRGNLFHIEGRSRSERLRGSRSERVPPDRLPRNPPLSEGELDPRAIEEPSTCKAMRSPA